GGAAVHLVGTAGAVGDDVPAQLAVGRLAVAVDLAPGDLDPLHDDLEVPHHALDGRVDLGLGGQHVAPVVEDGRAGLHLREALQDDGLRLLHLLDAHVVAVEVVALGPQGHVPAHLVVDPVGMGLAHVVVHARGPQHRSGEAEVHGVGAGDPAGVAGAI